MAISPISTDKTHSPTSSAESTSIHSSKRTALVEWLRRVGTILATPFNKAREVFQKSSGKMGAEIVSVHGGDTEQTGPTSQSRRRWLIPHASTQLLPSNGSKSWTLPRRLTGPEAGQVPNVGTEQPAAPNGVTPRRVETKLAPNTMATQTEHDPVVNQPEVKAKPQQCTMATQTEHDPVVNQREVKAKPEQCTIWTQTEQTEQTEPDTVVKQPKVNATLEQRTIEAQPEQPEPDSMVKQPPVKAVPVRDAQGVVVAPPLPVGLRGPIPVTVVKKKTPKASPDAGSPDAGSPDAGSPKASDTPKKIPLDAKMFQMGKKLLTSPRPVPKLVGSQPKELNELEKMLEKHGRLPSV